MSWELQCLYANGVSRERPPASRRRKSVRPASFRVALASRFSALQMGHHSSFLFGAGDGTSDLRACSTSELCLQFLAATDSSAWVNTI